jgi:filamentous hemagglutinin
VQGASVAIASGAGFTGIGTTGQQPAPGAVLATSGDAIVSGQTGVEAGAISANAARVAVTSANGPVTTGALTAALSVTASAAGEVRTGIVTAGTFADIASTTGAVVTGAVTAKTERARVVGAGSVTTGVVTAGREVEVTSSGGALQTGNLTGAATVAANGAQGVTVGVVDAGTGAALGSLSGAVTSGNITARAGAATITAARGVNAGAVTATTAINATGGDDVVLGSLTAPTIVVAATGGDVTVQGATGQRFSASARAGTAGPGDITVAGAVNLSGGATPTNPALRIQASNAVTIQAPVTSVFDGFVQAGGTLTTAAPVRITGAVGVTTLGGQPALPTFGGLDLRAGDVVIGDVVIVRGGAGLTVSALGGGATVGDGLTGPTQGLLALSNAELQRLDAATVSLRVGLSDPTSGGQSAVLTGSSIQVGDLTVDRARIGQLALVTGSTGAVRVRGVVSGIGAPSVSFGDSQSRPGAIEITGSVGTLDRPIGSTSFLSSGDVLFGTQAFVDRVNQASDPTIMDIAGLARDFGGATSGQVFLVTNAADFNTPGVILSQNTGATGAFAGLRFGTPTAAGGSVFTATGAPQRIEVFGVVVRADGTLATGADAALAPNLLASGPAIDTDFKINDCVIGQAGGCTTAKTFDPVVLTSVKMLQPGPGSRGNPGSSASRPNGGPPGGTARRTKEAASRFEVDPSIQDLQSTGDDSDQRDPGVGAANEDLWPTE